MRVFVCSILESVCSRIRVLHCVCFTLCIFVCVLFLECVCVFVLHCVYVYVCVCLNNRAQRTEEMSAVLRRTERRVELGEMSAVLY